MNERAPKWAWRAAGLVIVAVATAIVTRPALENPAEPHAPLPSPPQASTASPTTQAARDIDPHSLHNPAAVGNGAEPVPDALPELPASLRETDIDGGLLINEHGHLVVTIEVRRFFDYFLSASGEEPSADIRARIVAKIRRRLPATAATQAIALLDLYLEYRARVRQLADDESDPSDLAARLERLRSLRRATLGEATANAFFADEEAYDAVAAEERRIALDPTVADSDRERQLQDLEEKLPPAARAARDEALAPLRLAAEEDQLRAAGGSPEEIRALREQYFGSDGADRLEESDREQAIWQSRYGAYKADRLAIEGDTTRSAEERAAVLEELLNRHFSTEEQIRARALDTIDNELQEE